MKTLTYITMLQSSIPKCFATNIKIRTPFQEQSTRLHLYAVPPSLWGSTLRPELNCIRNGRHQIWVWWVFVRSGLSQITILRWGCRSDSYIGPFHKPRLYCAESDWTYQVCTTRALTWMMTMAALRLRCSTAALSSTGRAFPIFSMLVKPAECNCLALSTKLLMNPLSN